MSDKVKGVLLEAGAINRGDLSFKPLEKYVDLTIYENTTESDKYDHIGDAEVVFVNKVIMDDELFCRCPNIKYIGVCATGFNVIDLEAARNRGIVVTNVPAYSTDSVVQLAWSMILEMTCNLRIHNESVKAGDWEKSDVFCYWLEPIMELSGKTLGIVGYGNIGRKVAKIAETFGMKVLVHTAHPEKYENINGGQECLFDGDNNIKFVSLDELFNQSHIISLHCPLTDDTKEIINKDNISKCKDGVMLVNVSRGGLVNEGDLRDALISGKVKKAAVDVVSFEPMRSDNPLKDAPNIIITPHMAWASLEARKRLVNVVASNYENFLNGKGINIVND